MANPVVREVLIPTEVTLADLADIDSDINSMRTAGDTAEDVPRTRPLDWVTVSVTDAPGADTGPDYPEGRVFYTQKHFTGEWLRIGSKLGGFTDADQPVIVPEDQTP